MAALLAADPAPAPASPPMANQSAGNDEDRSQESAIPSPLTLEQAERIFLTHGLDLLVAEAQVIGAEGDLRAAQMVQNPVLSGDFLYGFSVGTNNKDPAYAPAVPGFSFGLSDASAIEDILSNKRGLRIDIAKHALAAARLGRDDAQRTLLSQVRSDFTAALLAQENAAFAENVQGSYQRTRDLNQIRLDKGDISEVDLSRIVVAQLESLQQRDQALAQLIQAKAALAFLLGSRTHALDFTVAGDLSTQPLPKIDGNSPDGLTQTALGHRPDLLAAVTNREQLAVTLTQARRLAVPDISLQVGYSQQFVTTAAGGIVSPPTISVGLQSPIPVFYQQQGEIKRAEANLFVAQHQEQKARAQVVSDVTQGYAAYVSAREMVKRMEGELLKNAKLSRDLEETRYRKGAAPLLEFLDAERTFVATNLEYRQDLQNYWSAVFQLEQATGTQLR